MRRLLLAIALLLTAADAGADQAAPAILSIRLNPGADHVPGDVVLTAARFALARRGIPVVGSGDPRRVPPMRVAFNVVVVAAPDDPNVTIIIGIVVGREGWLRLPGNQVSRLGLVTVHNAVIVGKAETSAVKTAVIGGVIRLVDGFADLYWPVTPVPRA